MILSDNVIYVGDIHGEFKTFIHLIKRYKISNATLIQVGDFGIGFSKVTQDRLDLLDLNIFLKKIDTNLLVIRGNHDDPKFFDGSFDLSNIKLLPDYSQFTINNLNYLFVGGAISVDREQRKAKMLQGSKPHYWVDEGFVFDENKIRSITNIDVLITHTAPLFVYPYHTDSYDSFMKERFDEDKYLRLDLVKERNNLSLLFQLLRENGSNIKEHYYGHYHQTYRQEIDGCIHQLLNINEFK